MDRPIVRRLRYATTCSSCRTTLPAGSRGIWDATQKRATCEQCLQAKSPQIDRGRAGASAEREGQRRAERHERRIREAHPRLGGLILTFSDEPKSIRSWRVGAAGERRLGEALDALRDEGMAVLHDRRMPGTRANIDHVVISSGGVFVIDAKRYSGRVECRDRGGWFQSDHRL